MNGCCDTPGHHGSAHGGGCCQESGGCGHEGFQRRFKTKKEKLERLKNYQAELETELEAVKEKIKELA